MAALRSALTTISRGSSVSSAAANMGGKGIEILRRAAPPIPAMEPPLHTAAIRHLQGSRRFSAGIKEPTDKAKSGMCMWWQRFRSRMKNASLEERSRVQIVAMVFGLGTPTAFLLKATSDLRRLR